MTKLQKLVIDDLNVTVDNLDEVLDLAVHSDSEEDREHFYNKALKKIRLVQDYLKALAEE